MQIKIDIICEILKFPIIKLSTLKPSIIALINPYKAKYIYVNCPLYFLLYLNLY